MILLIMACRSNDSGRACQVKCAGWFRRHGSRRARPGAGSRRKRQSGQLLLWLIHPLQTGRGRAMLGAWHVRGGVGSCVISASPLCARCCGFRRRPRPRLSSISANPSSASPCSIDGTELYRWPVSTGRRGHVTPSGTFHPIRLERHWYSRQYELTPMPWAMFFFRGYAVHGTMEAYNLGHVASHGCVRLRPDHAATLFSAGAQAQAVGDQDRGARRPAAADAGRGADGRGQPRCKAGESGGRCRGTTCRRA